MIQQRRCLRFLLAYAILALLGKAGKSATPRALGVPYLPENPAHLVNPCKYMYHFWYYLLDIMTALLCSLLKFSADRQFNLAQTHQPDLILLDMMLSNLSANQVIDDLKHDSKTATTPIIAVTPLTMTQDDNSTMLTLMSSMLLVVLLNTRNHTRNL